MRKRRFIVRKKGSALLRICLILGILLVLAGAGYGIFALTGSQEQSQGLEQLPFTADTNYVFTGSGFLYMYGDRLTYDDLLDAKKDASYQVSTGSVQLAASPTLSVLYHDTAVQILGAAESLTFTQQVEQVACGVNHVAVLLRGEDQAMSLQVYDKAGTQTDQMDFPDGELMDFGFAQTQDDTLWTLEMAPAGSLPLSTLTTYNLATNHTTGVMTIQGQLVDQVWFTQNSIFFSCTNNLIRFTRTGNTEAYRLLVYGWELCDVSTAGSTPLFLYRERGATGTSGTVKIYALPEGETASATVSAVQLPAGTLGAFLAGGNLYACTQDTLYVYSSTGKQTNAVALPRTVDRAQKLSETHLLLTGGNGLYVAALR